jgi:alcohol dehydrogenase (cytochrome c)
MLFRGFPDGHVIAIDASTGRTLWNQSIIAAGSHEFISAAPLAWNGSIVIGTGNGDNAVICHVAALDQASGKILWTIATITSGKTWKGAQHLAGGATWTSFSVDAATGKLYVPVGNPGPDYDTRLRKGANLNTNSVLELDPATGALLRGLQVIPNDFHDWDQAAAPAIVTLKSGGKIMLTAGKDGYLRGVNLATFASIWKTPVTTISNATAPITTQDALLPGRRRLLERACVFAGDRACVHQRRGLVQDRRPLRHAATVRARSAVAWNRRRRRGARSHELGLVDRD